jgi:predicted RNase H-like nuclease (RuvC/YqgF family)
MAKVFPKRDEEEDLFAEETPLPTPKGEEEELALILQQLSSEEATLREQKENLELLREQLQKKAKEEVDNRKNTIQKLKLEITDLKGDCEKLTKSLRTIQTFQQSGQK